MVVATDRYIAEDAVDRIRVEWEPLPAGGRCAARRGRRRTPAHADVPDNVSAHLLQTVGDAPAAIDAAPQRARAAPGDRALGLDAVGGQGRLRPVGHRRPLAAGLQLDPDVHLGALRARRQARPPRRPGRGHRPARRRRLRREDHAPVAGGGARPVGGHPAAARGEVGRGPAGALHLLGARARPGAHGAGGLRRRRPDPRAGRAVPPRQRGLHAVRHRRADHHLHPAARPVQAGQLPGRVPLPLHEHGDRHAVPRRRTGARLLRDGAGHGRDRRPPGPRPSGGSRAQHDPAGRAAVRPADDLPGRATAHLRHRRLPSVAAQGAARWWTGPASRRYGRPPPPRGAAWASGWRPMWREPGSGRTRGPTSGSRPAATSWWRPA